MNIKIAESKAIELINKYIPDWRFKFDRSKRRFGACMHSSKTISLSKYLVELNVESEVIDTILHEIAHALAGPQHGHDDYWKSKCIELGARPERCYDASKVVQPEKKIKYVCPNGHIRSYHRMLKKTYACVKCCTDFNFGKYSEQFKLVKIDTIE